MLAIFQKIWRIFKIGGSGATARLKRGTIYLRGEQSHFHIAVARALRLDPRDRRLNFKIYIDLLQSLRNRILTYRVDYVVDTAGARGFSGTSQASLW